jgi:hypothetical protein
VGRCEVKLFTKKKGQKEQDVNKKGKKKKRAALGKDQKNPKIQKNFFKKKRGSEGRSSVETSPLGQAEGTKKKNQPLCLVEADGGVEKNKSQRKPEPTFDHKNPRVCPVSV